MAAAEISLDMLSAMHLSAHRIAALAVVADIECNAVAVGPLSRRTYDVRPMLDAREHSPEELDMAREALGYALGRGLVVRDDEAQPYLVRIVGGGR